MKDDVVSLEEYRRVCECRRVAERLARSIEARARKYERILALAMRLATSDGRDADPLVSLAMLERLDDLIESEPPERTLDELAQLLRETDPALFRELAQKAPACEWTDEDDIAVELAAPPTPTCSWD